MATSSEAFRPLGPVELVRANGIVRAYGLGATTDAARGTALLAARTAATIGDKINVTANCDVAGDYTKQGVVFKLHPGVVIRNTSNLTTGDYNDLPAFGSQEILNMRRNVLYRAPSDRLTYWHANFASTADVVDSLINYTGSGSPAMTISGGKLIYTQTASASTANRMGQRYLPCSQLCSGVRIDAINSVGSYNDVHVGFAFPLTATGAGANDKIVALLRMPAANSIGKIQLFYTYNGGTLVSTGVSDLATAFVPGSYLYCVLNHNTIALVINDNGRQKQLLQLEINTAHHDMQLYTKATGMRPFLGFQSDGAANNSVSDWFVSSWGTIGDREMQAVRYENGEPVKSPDGYYYVAADTTGPNTLTTSDLDVVARSQGAMYLYDADAKRPVAMTAKYSQKVTVSATPYLIGAQEVNWMYDRTSQSWHGYFSCWNLQSHGQAVRIFHCSRKTNPLHGHVVIDDATEIPFATDLGLGGVWTSAAIYGSTCPKYENGYWYMGGTIAAPTYNSFVVRGDSPSHFTSLLWLDQVNTEEGTFLWRYKGTTYAVTCSLPNTIRIRNLTTGTVLRTMTIQGGGSLSPLPDLLQVIRSSTTDYQYLNFTTDDFVADSGSQKFAFGPWLVGSMGSASGHEFTPLPSDAYPNFGGANATF
jgi:hypothetical protein